MKAAEIKKQVLDELDVWMSAFNAKDLEAWSNTHNFHMYASRAESLHIGVQERNILNILANLTCLKA